MRLKYYFIAFISSISAILGFFFSIEAVWKGTKSSRTSALYMLARSIALVFIAIVPICIRADPLLIIVIIAMLIVQITDCLVGVYIKRKTRIIGPAIMAIAHALSIWAYL